MSFVSSQCAAQSLGPANELFGALVQTILTVQCAISAPELWPKDYGPSAMQHGETSFFLFYLLLLLLNHTINVTFNESPPTIFGSYVRILDFLFY